jgi:hypothetical protein
MNQFHSQKRGTEAGSTEHREPASASNAGRG